MGTGHRHRAPTPGTPPAPTGAACCETAARNRPVGGTPPPGTGHRASPGSRREPGRAGRAGMGRGPSGRVPAAVDPKVGGHRPVTPPGGARCRPAPSASGGLGEPGGGGGGRAPGRAMLPAALRRWLHRPKVRAAAADTATRPVGATGDRAGNGAAASPGAPGAATPAYRGRWAPGAAPGRGADGAPSGGALPVLPGGQRGRPRGCAAEGGGGPGGHRGRAAGLGGSPRRRWVPGARRGLALPGQGGGGSGAGGPGR